MELVHGDIVPLGEAKFREIQQAMGSGLGTAKSIIDACRYDRVPK